MHRRQRCDRAVPSTSLLCLSTQNSTSPLSAPAIDKAISDGHERGSHADTWPPTAPPRPRGNRPRRGRGESRGRSIDRRRSPGAVAQSAQSGASAPWGGWHWTSPCPSAGDEDGRLRTYLHSECYRRQLIVAAQEPGAPLEGKQFCHGRSISSLPVWCLHRAVKSPSVSKAKSAEIGKVERKKTGARAGVRHVS